MADLTRLEVRLISGMLSSHTDEQIADVLEKPVADVRLKIRQITGMDITPYQAKLHNKKVVQKSRAVVKQQKRQEKKIKETFTDSTLPRTRGLIAAQESERRRRNEVRDRPLANKAVDYSRLISVRVDHKTTIYIKPGEDPEAAKEKYLKRLYDCRVKHDVTQKRFTEVKKFKPIK